MQILGSSARNATLHRDLISRMRCMNTVVLRTPQLVSLVSLTVSNGTCPASLIRAARMELEAKEPILTEPWRASRASSSCHHSALLLLVQLMAEYSLPDSGGRLSQSRLNGNETTCL